MNQFACLPLNKRHDRLDFCCGVDELDAWFRERASQDQGRHVAAVYVLTPVDEPTRVAGFYTLSATSVVLSDLPLSVARKLPRYPIVPAVLIGRLARDTRFANTGELLLVDALQRAHRHASEIAAAAVVVDAKNRRASDFYRRYGFAPLGSHPGRLFLSMAAIGKLFSS